MAANEEFFRRRQAAAVLKHGVLSRYLPGFTAMAGADAEEVVLLDGYAGPGRGSLWRAAWGGVAGPSPRGLALASGELRPVSVIAGCPDTSERWPGVLVEWRRGAHGWEGRCVYVVHDGGQSVVVEAWVLPGQLTPA